ncbi:MAG: hypothetical protein P0Y53_19865 [Candidatus Pseudobacter hemicellulosilyticus]|uniref:Tellurite resistance protein TerB n=1 Tax=Candidatus Pseudobacter hemicellulosilyticus TaxID=3121375 RepID=A0AAJ5WP79_9BACT|nr:MAG: hypothetical protein P0Y53_19865 [Pseudobacter sp.]
MYTTDIKSQDEALTHLFFHCCLKDKVLADAELEAVSAKLVAAGLNKTLNFKDEIVKYRNYSEAISSETEYLRFLVEQINPVNELALYSYCAELVLSDNTMSPEEEALLVNIGETLGLEDTEQAIVKRLMIQRKVVETDKLF